ncbi:MAG TPA: class I SAM-dependent methyltransferase [Actinocrinis sp.]|uniref:class I SAM-dependent methyltransferase n=1 Tax=Actinocrinis sp. TaxID=1920516 RepID=UPI002D6F2756|nr:class I SAM-dependent methyltransferase [Actinocrinis sp.]HZU58063.1 class I SAM-dependent methyltransferase [Actinocrinis sp.]
MGEEVVTQTPPSPAGSGRRAHPWFAKYYSRVSVAMDRGGLAQYRRRLLEGLSGEVAEIGPGNGLNFRHYPVEVTRLVAVEPEPTLRAKARQAADEVARSTGSSGNIKIEVIGGVAERMPLADASCDAVVVSLVLCSVPDQQAALDEVRRVLRPGGEFRFMEHVRSQGRAAAWGQRVLDATVWPLLGAGCHCSRETGAAVSAAGFEISALSRFRFPPRLYLPDPTASHVLGLARKPA